MRVLYRCGMMIDRLAVFGHSVVAQVQTLRQRYRFAHLMSTCDGHLQFEFVSLGYRTKKREIPSYSRSQPYVTDKIMEMGDLIFLIVFLLPGCIHGRPSC